MGHWKKLKFYENLNFMKDQEATSWSKSRNKKEPLEHVTRINDCVTLVTRGIDVTLVSK